jgi:flagellar motility protein MotE (MotC chaperone)
LLEIQKLDKKQKSVEQKNREFQKLVEIKGSQAFLYEENMKALSEEVDYLQGVIQNDLALKGLKWDPTTNEVEEIPDFREDKLKNKHETLTNDLEIYLTRLNDCITEIEGEHSQKKQNIDGMNNLLKAMLKGQKIDESTQVNEGELFWGTNNVTKQDVVHINFGASNLGMSAVHLDKPEIKKELPAISTVELVRAFEE